MLTMHAADSERKPDGAVETQGAAAGELMVEVDGIGATQREAQAAALRAAVERVVGSLVRASDRVENDRLIESKVLTFSDGFVARFEPIGRPAVKDGLVEVRLRAWVRQERITRVLSESGVRTVAIDARSMRGEVETLRDRRRSAIEVTADLFDGFPSNVCSASVLYTRPVDGPDGVLDIEVGVRVAIDRVKWRDWTMQADKTLGAVAENAGPIDWNLDRWDWGRPWTPETASLATGQPLFEPFQTAVLFGTGGAPGVRAKYVNQQALMNIVGRQFGLVSDWQGRSRPELRLLAVLDGWTGRMRGYVLPKDAWATVLRNADRIPSIRVELRDGSGRPCGTPLRDWRGMREARRIGEQDLEVFNGGMVGRPEAYASRGNPAADAIARVLYWPGVLSVTGAYLQQVNQPLLLPTSAAERTQCDSAPQAMLLPSFCVNGSIGQVATEHLVLPFRFRIPGSSADANDLSATVEVGPPVAAPW